MAEQRELQIEPEAIQAVIDAPGLAVAAEDTRAERLKICLASVLRRTIEKAPTKKLLTPGEMKRVMKAHDRFDELLRHLRGARHPPPALPSSNMESGDRATPWTRWYDALKFRSDKEELLSWLAIGELLAVYEALFATSIVQSNADAGISRPITFLRAAFKVVRSKVTREQYDLDRWYYRAPSVSALNDRLEQLKKQEMRAGELLVRRYLEGS